MSTVHPIWRKHAMVCFCNQSYSVRGSLTEGSQHIGRGRARTSQVVHTAPLAANDLLRPRRSRWAAPGLFGTLTLFALGRSRCSLWYLGRSLLARLRTRSPSRPFSISPILAHRATPSARRSRVPTREHPSTRHSRALHTTAGSSSCSVPASALSSASMPRGTVNLSAMWPIMAPW